MSVTASSPPMLLIAMGYVARGLAVIPLHTPTRDGCSCAKGPTCGSPGKHPRVDWKPFQERRATADQVRQWWDRSPDANLGVITGVVSRIAVLDVDPRNGGFDTLAELDASGQVMPDDNPLVETGALGLHHYLALDAALPKAAPFDGIELQADGALVVVPPSLHRSGRRYRWLRGLDAPWAPVPAWLRAAATQMHTPPAAGPVIPIPDVAGDNVLGALQAAGLYVGRHRRVGLHRVRCPWSATHSNEDTEAVVLEPGASVAPGWGFRCLHAHCVERRIGALLDLLQIPRRWAA
jgi:Bifunctional DNA primase/polymerase, N-terminal